VLQQQVYAHQLDAGLRLHREDGILGANGPAVDAEALGDGGAGNVGVQNGGAVAPALHGDGQLAGDHGFADAALAGDDAVDLTDMAALMKGLDLEGASALTVSAALAAAAAIVGAFTHGNISFIIIVASKVLRC